MRIVIDMQGAQTESRFRGIGRYTLSLAQAIVRNRSGHEIILALSGLFPDTIKPIKAAFDGLLPPENILVWHAPGPVSGPSNINRTIAELIREDFFLSLRADFLIISSLFEGYGDNAVTSIGNLGVKSTVAVILYDLIPFLNQENYLSPNPEYKSYYLEKIEYLKNATMCFSISDFSKVEAVSSLGLVEESVVSISTAADPIFKKINLSFVCREKLKRKLNISKEIILYTGGADDRKNLPRLIEAFSRLPEYIRDQNQLVFVGKMPQNSIDILKDVAKKNEIKKGELIFTGYIDELTLVDLYNISKLFIFPSWHEGFGLPVLEAMSCGIPVLASNATSLPEVIGFADSLFDPFNVDDISKKMKRVLTDADFSNKIVKHGLEYSKNFSWDLSAARAMHSIESFLTKNILTEKNLENHSEQLIYQQLAKHMLNNTDHQVLKIASCLDSNWAVSNTIGNFKN